MKNVSFQILFGHSLHVAWGWLMFTGSVFLTTSGNLVNLSFIPDSLYTLSLFANMATLLVCAWLIKLNPAILNSKAIPYLAAILMSLGTFCGSNYSLLVFSKTTLLVELSAGILTGIGAGLFLVLWGKVFISLGTNKCLVYFASSSFIAALFHIICRSIPVLGVQAIVIIAPLLELSLYLSYVLPRKGLDLPTQPTTMLPFPKEVAVLCLFFGFAFGSMRAITGSFSGFDSAMSHIISMAFVMGGCVLAYFTSILIETRFGSITYSIALPMVALGFLLIPNEGPLYLFGIASFRIGYEYIYIILWALWVYIAKTSKVPLFSVAIGMGLLQLGKFSGFIIFTDATLLLGPLDLNAISGAWLFAILLFALFAYRSEVPYLTGWKSIYPSSEKEVNLSEEQFQNLAFKKYNLSPREEEVCRLLLKGRSRTHIANELFVAEETIKTHTKSIYQKTGVHDKQELISLFEEKATTESKQHPKKTK